MLQSSDCPVHLLLGLTQLILQSFGIWLQVPLVELKIPYEPSKYGVFSYFNRATASK